MTEQTTNPTPRRCGHCGAALPPPGRGKPRRWCSDACKMAAYRKRKQAYNQNT